MKSWNRGVRGKIVPVLHFGSRILSGEGERGRARTAAYVEGTVLIEVSEVLRAQEGHWQGWRWHDASLSNSRAADFKKEADENEQTCS